MNQFICFVLMTHSVGIYQRLKFAHSSIRFSIGRFTTEEDVDFAIDLINKSLDKLREMSPLWEMFKEGIDLDTVEWTAH